MPQKLRTEDVMSKLAVASEAREDGTVRIRFIEDGRPIKTIIGMPADLAVRMAASILAAALEASKRAGIEPESPTSLAGVPCIRPSAIGLSASLEPGPLALVVHIGAARFCLLLENQLSAELARTLITASAERDQKH
jgi:hypothetical protein